MNFLYVDEDETRNSNVSVIEDVVLQVMAPLILRRYNFARDIVFTLFDLSLRLQEKICSLVGYRRIGIKCQMNPKSKNLQETEVQYLGIL